MTRREWWLSAVAVVLVAVFLVACGKDEPTAPTPVVPACQANNTAQVAFKNGHGTATITVLWDGATLTTIAPGVTTQHYTVAAGVQHSLVARLTNTTQAVCTATPVFAQCSSHTMTCSF